MIRFLMKYTEVRFGVTRVSYSCIDHDLATLERVLVSGGYGEDACEFVELVGAEVMPESGGRGDD